ncbi:guanylate kinase [Patescibacteria group bacterium]
MINQKLKLKPDQKLFVISGPSGVGKDTVIEGLKKFLDFNWVISTTDRKIRKGEKEGKPYYFVSPSKLNEMIKNNQFIEYDHMYNFRAGTTFAAIENAFQDSQVVIWKGYPQSLGKIKEIVPEATLIAILPPIFSALEKRLRKRGADSEESIQERIAVAKEDLKALEIADYKVINPEGKPELASKEIFEIIQKKET